MDATCGATQGRNRRHGRIDARRIGRRVRRDAPPRMCQRGRAAARTRRDAVQRDCRPRSARRHAFAAAGGAIGVALAFMGIAALARFGPADMPRLQMIAVDADVLSYAMAATLFSALLFGLTPA